MRIGAEQSSNRVATGAAGGEEMQRSPCGIADIRVGAAFQENADLGAVAVVGVAVQERPVAGAFVDVPAVPQQQRNRYSRRRRRQELDRSAIGVGAAFEQKAVAADVTGAELLGQRRVAIAMRGRLDIDVGAAVEEPSSHGRRLPMVDRPGDAPSCDELGGCESG